MATAVATLKSYFENGDVPTEQEFVELIEAFVHKDDDLGALLGQLAEVNEAEQGLVQDKYMTPFLTNIAIKALTRLSSIPELNQEVDTKISDAINNLLTLDDADSVINTIKDVLDAFNGLNEGQTLVDLLQGKEDVFSKNSGFNKSFGTGFDNVPRGNHEHDTLNFGSNSGFPKAQATFKGLQVLGDLEVDDNVTLRNVLTIKPNTSNINDSAFIYRYTGEDKLQLRVDGSSGPNFSGLFEFKQNGDMTFSSISDRIRERDTGTQIGSTSDARLKRNVSNLSDELDNIMRLRPVKYLFHDKADEGKTNADKIGFIAQEVEAIYPELVDTSAQGFKSLDYSKITAVLTKVIQEQQSVIEDLLNKVNTIQEQLNN